MLLFVLLFIGFEFLTGRVLRHFLPRGHHSAVMPVRLGLIMEGAQLAPLLSRDGESWH